MRLGGADLLETVSLPLLAQVRRLFVVAGEEESHDYQVGSK